MSPEQVIFNYEPEPAAKWERYIASNVADQIGSFHYCLVLNALRKTGVAQKMRSKKTFALADLGSNLHKGLLERLVNYLKIKGDVKSISSHEFALTEKGARSFDDTALAQIEFYVEAYLPVTQKMGELLDGSLTYGSDVVRNGAALGGSCDTLFSIYHTPIIHQIVKDQSATKIVDLGCGGGQLLIDACKTMTNVVGVGIDISEGAVNLANSRAKENNLESRLSFHVGDAFDMSTWPKIAMDANLLCAVGAIHEHFRDGEEAVVNILNHYADFVSKNGSNSFILGEPELYYDDEENDSDLNLVHIFTAQGFPRKRADWVPVIEKSRFRIDRVYTRSGIGPRFNFFKLIVKNR